MSDVLVPYASGILALGSLGALYLVQLLVADLVAVKRRHVPGTPVDASHADLLFRATRAHANTTESIGAVILIAGFAIAMAGDPTWINNLLWLLVGFRALHMAAYYANIGILRSIAFALSFGTLMVLFGVGLGAL